MSNNSPSEKVAAAATQLPSIFVASIGGFFDGSFAVEWTDEKLVYRKHNGYKEQQEVLRPTAKEWRNFRAMLDQINVWAWQDPLRATGHGWHRVVATCEMGRPGSRNLGVQRLPNDRGRSIQGV